MKKLTLLLLLFSFSYAQQESVEELKRQLDELKKKVEVLEKALKEEEKKAEEKPAPADKTLQLRSKYEERLKVYQFYPFKQTAFLPDISLILDTSYVGRNLKDETFKKLETPGLYHKHDGENHGELNEKRGFNLNYAELYLYAPVDPYFDLYATIPFSEHGSEVEEAYAVTRGLPFSLQLKVGKFRSSFGRLNSQHPHLWDFANQPLVYKVFFGDDGLVEKGAQINWLAPTPFYLLLGVEALQGENEQSFGTEGFEIGGQRIGDTREPNLYVGFVKTSFDVGSLSVLTGLSYATGKTRIYHEDNAFAGKTKIYGLDLTAKYFIDSYRYVSFQGEYLWRDQKGTGYSIDDQNNLVIAGINKRQGGFYSQLVWRFAPRWRVGAQYNLINKNDVKADGKGINLSNNLPAYYTMVEFNPTEFSRLRLQVGQNRSLFYGDRRKTVNEVVIQFNFAIGAHGAHPF